MLTSQSLEILLEKTTHLNNPISHTLDFAQPLLAELGIVHNGRSDAGAVDGRVGVERTNEDFDLRVDALLLLGGSADERKCTSSFTVETLYKSLEICNRHCQCTGVICCRRPRNEQE